MSKCQTPLTPPSSDAESNEEDNDIKMIDKETKPAPDHYVYYGPKPVRTFVEGVINYDEPYTQKCVDFDDRSHDSFYIPFGLSYGQFDIETKSECRPRALGNNEPYYWFNRSPLYWLMSPYSYKMKCVQINLFYSFESIKCSDLYEVCLYIFPARKINYHCCTYTPRKYHNHH